MVNTGSLVGWGLGEPKIYGVGPTVVARKAHQRWWFGCVLLVLGRYSSLQLCLARCGAQGKNPKNITTMGKGSSAERLNTQEISNLETYHKILKYSWKFSKI